MVGRWRYLHGQMYLLPDSGFLQRLVQPVYYALFVTAGTASFVNPTQLLRAHVPPWGTYIWGAFYVVGGLCCLVGSAKKRIVGGVIGLPLLSSASALYGLSILLQIDRSHDGGYLIAGCLILGQSVTLLDRWIGALLLFKNIKGVGDDV